MSVAEAKLPAAMRLPRHEMTIVDSFAEQRGVSRTDAFLHFLRKGIEAEQGGDGSGMTQVQESLEEIVRLLKRDSFLPRTLRMILYRKD